MPFDNGSVSFMIYEVPGGFPDNHLELFAEKAVIPLEKVKDEPVLGFAARHLLDGTINDDTAYIGDFLHMFFRSAVRKVPSSLLQAECMVEEMAFMQAENVSVISRKKKKEIKEHVIESLIKYMPPQLKGIPFFFDKIENLIYVGCSSVKQADEFIAYIIDAIDVEPIPTSPDLYARRFYGGPKLEFDSIDFSGKGNVGEEEYNIGRDFLTWIWYLSEENEGAFTVPDLGEFNIGIDGPLQLAAETVGAFESVIRKGSPLISPEAQTALLAGKKLRSAKLTIGRGDEFWSFGLDADNFVFRSLKVPDGEALERVSKFEERVNFFDVFQKAFYTLYKKFLEEFNPENRAESEKKVQEWVTSRIYHHPEGQDS